MLLWKPLLAVVPAGLLLGLVAGQATRPEMLVKDDGAWPYARDESAREADRWPSFDLSEPDVALRGYSYRPDIDYDRYVWPDQTDRSAELLAADYDYPSFDVADRPADNLPLTRRAVMELVARHDEGAAAVPAGELAIAGSRERAPADAAPAAGTSYVLPPVPPPLAHAGTLPDPAEPDDGEAF